jgi:hypothetical protein
MREQTKYAGRYTKFQSKYTGQTNPDTGFTYTSSEIQSLFEEVAGDPDGDGVTNLLEYAFGGDGLEQLDDERKNLPRKRPLKRRTAGPKKFQLSFLRRSAANDSNLTYTVETSTDMYNWTSSGLTEVSSEAVDGGMEYVTYELDKPYTDADAPKNQFMRINVTTAE